MLARALCDMHEQYIWRFLRAQKINLSGRKSWCDSTDPAFMAKAANDRFAVVPKFAGDSEDHRRVWQRIVSVYYRNDFCRIRQNRRHGAPSIGFASSFSKSIKARRNCPSTSA